MSIDWTLVTSTFLTSTVLVAAVGFVGRSVISQFFSRGLEAYKGDLSRDLERHKSELQRITFEHTTTFSVMHQRRADVIQRVYEFLVTAEERAEVYLDPQNTNDPEERLDSAYAALRELKRYFDRNRILLTSDLCAHATRLIDAIHGPMWAGSYLVGRRSASSMTSADDRAELVEQWKKFRTGVAEFRPRLEEEFRKTIGSEFEDRS